MPSRRSPPALPATKSKGEIEGCPSLSRPGQPWSVPWGLAFKTWDRANASAFVDIGWRCSARARTIKPAQPDVRSQSRVPKPQNEQSRKVHCARRLPLPGCWESERRAVIPNLSQQLTVTRFFGGEQQTGKVLPGTPHDRTNSKVARLRTPTGAPAGVDGNSYNVDALSLIGWA